MRLLFFFSILLVFIMSILNSDQIPNLKSLSFISDKLVHFVIYFYLAYVGLKCQFKISDLFLIFLIFLFGAFVELIHYFHPYRFFEYFDLLANLFGVTIALQIHKLKKII